MKHIKVLELTEADRLKLEKDYQNDPTHNYRIKCKSNNICMNKTL